MDNKNITIKDAMNRLKQAMTEEPDYAYGWHSNIAMACYTSIFYTDMDNSDRVQEIANESASRFMKMCFDVETSKDMLLKDEDNNV